MTEKKPTDKELGFPKGFPFDEDDVPKTIGGRIYQWVKNKHYERRKPWNKSDVFIWKGACLHLGSWIGILVMITVFGYIFLKTYELFGIEKFLSVVAIVFLIRISILVRTLNEVKSELKELNKKFKM